MSSALVEDFWKDDFVPLVSAGKAILKELREDESAPDADLYRRMLASGESSHLYFTEKSIVRHEKTLPPPESLVKEVKAMRASNLMGVFAEANLAWMSVDHKLFLWPVGDSSGFCSLTIPSGQYIVSVGFSRPKKGVFVKSVEWCLVVTTPDEVLLCALARRGGPLELIPTRYNIPTDEVPILTVCGTPSGRIFLGGYDGSLYEMAYESLVGGSEEAPKSTEQMLNDYYDGNAPISSLQPETNDTMATQVLSSGKRAISSILVGGPQTPSRPRKCRKLNHSSTVMSTITKNVLPEFLLKATSSIFQPDRSKAGPLTQIVHDAERNCLFTLNARGYLSAFDLRSTTLHQTSGLDTDKTARLYLSAVARGHMYPSHTNITFPGGGASAQAGVGGMDGARAIIRMADSATNKMKNVLTPVSMHVVSRHESRKLSLVIITAGGLRYYLSTLPSIGGDRGHSISKSSMKLTLCYIRAPIPIDPNTGKLATSASFDKEDLGGILPNVVGNACVDAGVYQNGLCVIALGSKDAGGRDAGGSTTEIKGNSLVVTTPDSTARRTKMKDTAIIREAPGGVTEAVSLPMEDSDPSMIPGGPVLAVCTINSPASPVMNLMFRSQTPTDSELGIIVPPYFPKKSQSASTSKDVPSSAAKTSMGVVNTSSGTLIRSNGVGSSTGSVALTLIKNFLLSRPLSHGLRYQAASGSTRGFTQQLYRISGQYGCSSSGFSSTASGKSGAGSLASASRSVGSHRSARLSAWLLRPSVVPLNGLFLQHLQPDRQQIMAITLGGMHYFSCYSALARLAEALMAVRTANVEHVTKFFQNYGFKQGCSMCLTLAIGCGPAKGNGGYQTELRARASHAALRHALVPRLIQKQNSSDTSTTIVGETSPDPCVPKGYEFIASALSDGMSSLLSRLLRPMWYKPAVVVTEVQTIRRQGQRSSVHYPAKVELLLDNNSLAEIRKPLYALQELMKQLFAPAISVVPGRRRTEESRMEIDELPNGSLITGGLLFQNSVRDHGEADSRLSPREAEKVARLLEERNIHSLYRLLSRAIQLLDLLSLLERAQDMPDLPEVDWGLLHGLQMSQLVQSQEAQERVETVLNSLVSAQAATVTTAISPSADANILANQLSTQCYLYFSPGSRFAYLGFRTAIDALSCAESSPRRRTLASEAITHLKRAATSWYSAAMITGRVMHSGEMESYDNIALRALQYDSPLAKAAAILMELKEVSAVVELCSITASNFGAKKPPSSGSNSKANGKEVNAKVSQDWERGLYHKRRNQSDTSSTTGSLPSSSSDSRALVVGTNVTAKDAISTCYAIVFHHLIKMLDVHNQDLADRMVKACAASPDSDFKKALFEHMLVTNHVDTLLKIEGKDVEEWLKTSNKDSDLLWRYYTVQQSPNLAGQLLWGQATETSPSIPLAERLEFLRKALNSYTSALAAGPQRFSMSTADLERLITEIRESQEVALIQERTLKVIESSSLADKLEDGLMEKLQMTLVPVSDLYNKYAAPLNLFDTCLLILHSCRHDDASVIETLWKSIMCEEILPCATRSPYVYNFLRGFTGGSIVESNVELLTDITDHGYTSPLFEYGRWIDNVRGRMVTLGKDLFGRGADYVFPVAFLVSRLEGLRMAQFIGDSSSDDPEASPWPLKVLLDVGVPFPYLLDAYESIMEGEGRTLMGDVDAQTRLWNVKSLLELLEEWVSRARSSIQNSALNQLAIAVATGKLMSRVNSLKSTVEGVGTEDSRPIYLRLGAVEDAITRLT